MSHNNFIQLIGYLGNDPEVLTTSDQKTFVKVSLATTEPVKDKSGQYASKACWHVIYFNGILAEYAKTLKKGIRVRVRGRLDYKDWVDSKKDVKHRSAFVIAKEMIKHSKVEIEEE